jgi:hypothetical protein
MPLFDGPVFGTAMTLALVNRSSPNTKSIPAPA